MADKETVRTDWCFWDWATVFAMLLALWYIREEVKQLRIDFEQVNHITHIEKP